MLKAYPDRVNIYIEIKFRESGNIYNNKNPERVECAHKENLKSEDKNNRLI